MLSFSLDNQKSIIASATKKLIGIVNSRMRGSINKYNLNNSKKVISIYDVTFAI